MTSPAGPPLSQEIANLKKTIEEKNKSIAEFKSKLEANEKLISEKEKQISQSVSLLEYTFCFIKEV